MIDINKLTDVELNRAMIWLYPEYVMYGIAEGKHDYKLKDNGDYIYFEPTYHNYYGESIYVEFLENWNLTMPLAYESRLIIDFEDDMCHDSCAGFYVFRKKPLRMICEVLVSIKLHKTVFKKRAKL